MEFWDQNPCDGHYDSLSERARFRYAKDAHIPVLLSLIRKDDIVLEVGCGQGTDTHSISRLTELPVTAVDFTQEAVKQTQKVLDGNGTVRQMDAQHLDFDDGSFTFVYSYGVMHHAKDTQKCIDETWRVLKPGGRAVIMMYNKWSPQFAGVWLARFVTKPFHKKIAERINAKQYRTGTFLQELFLCPIIKGYSDGDYRRMFSKFRIISIRNYMAGWSWLKTPIPTLSRTWDRLENMTGNALGLMKVATIQKPSA